MLIAGTALMIGAGALVAWYRTRPYDPWFDARVVNPVYHSGGPVVLFDEGHGNTHTTEGGYRPLANLLRSDGYRVRVSNESVTGAALRDATVLVLALARGANDANDSAAYSESEAAAIEQWVRNGGSLLLVTDHWPYGSAVSALARRFQVDMGSGLVEDPQHHDSLRGDSHLLFTTENGLLKDHPIVHGRSAAEQIRRVMTFTGQSIQGPRSAWPFLSLSPTAVERPPGPPKVERAGGNVRVIMEYSAPKSAAARAQGIAMLVDSGRMVVLGEAGMLRAHHGGKGEELGMNVPGYDNRQLALNILHWLSRVI